MQKHILVVPSWYPNTYNKNSGSFIIDQIKGLVSSGHNVGVIATTTVYWFYLTRYRKFFNLFYSDVCGFGANGFSLELFEFPPVGPKFLKWRIIKFNNFFKKTLMIRMYKKYVKKYGKPDLVHVHSIYPGEFVEYLKICEGLPIVLTEHWSGFFDENVVRKKLRDINFVYKNSNVIISVSSHLRDAIESVGNFKKQITVIPNAVDVNLFFSQPEKAEVFTFVAIGYLIEVKRFDRLLKAFAKTLRINECKLVLIGDGHLHDDLLKLATELDIISNVEFKGVLSKNEVAKIIRESHCLISSSDRETFGVTLIESIASGVPVVATNSGGPSEIVKKEVGYLVEKNVDSLADGMCRIIDNFDSFDPEFLVGFAEREYAMSSIIKKIEKVYSLALKGN